MKEHSKEGSFSRQEIAILIIAAILSMVAATLIVMGLVQIAQRDMEAASYEETLNARREDLVSGIAGLARQYDEDTAATIEAAARKYEAGEASGGLLATLHIIPDTLPGLKSDGKCGEMIGELAETELLIAEAQAMKSWIIATLTMMLLLMPRSICSARTKPWNTEIEGPMCSFPSAPLM